MIKRTKTLSLCGLLWLIMHTTAFSGEETPGLEIRKIKDGFYRFSVAGFVNMMVFTGEDGVLFVDSGLDSAVDQVKSALTSLGAGKIRYILNTHADYDHIAGNSFFGDSVVVIAHRSCRDQLLTYASPGAEIPFDKTLLKKSLPDITFERDLTLYFNNEEIRLLYLPGGHTDEDVIVHIKHARIVFLGDIVLTGSFPVVKLENGGQISLLLENLRKIMEMFPEETIFVSGHGAEFSGRELLTTFTMVTETVAIVEDAVRGGKSLEDMKKENILGKWESWSGTVFEEVNTDMWIETIVKSLQKRDTHRDLM